jgi:hypothetical protein
MPRKRTRSRGGSSNLLTRRTLLLLLGGGGFGAASVYGTGAFSDVTGGRSVNIGTADDTSALVGLDVVEPVETGDGSTLVTVTNDTSEPLLVTGTLTAGTDPGVTIPAGSGQRTIASGGTAEFTVDVDPADQPEQIEFSLEAVDTETGDLSVSLSRSTTVESTDPCAGPRREIDGNRKNAVEENKTVVLSSRVSVDSYVDATGCVILNSKATIKSYASAGGAARLGPEAEIKGSVDAGGDVVIGSDAEIKGSIDADGTVTRK